MSENIEARVNHVEPLEAQTKFIVTQIDGEHVYDAMQLRGHIGYHREIGFEQHGSTRGIIGGGYTRLTDGGKTVDLYSSSGDFGTVRKETLDAMLPTILEAYQTIHPEVETIENNSSW